MSLGPIPVKNKKNAYNSKVSAFRIACANTAFELSHTAARNFDALRVKITRPISVLFWNNFDLGPSQILFSKTTRLAARIAFFLLTIVLALDSSAATLALNSVIATPNGSTSSVNLIWNASPGTNVTGYAVYYGVASRKYTNRIDVGSNFICTVSGLVSNQTYYFSANAYDAAGDESDFANEISVSTVVPQIVVPVTTPRTNNIIVTIPMLSAARLCEPWQTEAVFTLNYTNPADNKFFKAGIVSITNSAVSSTNIIIVTMPALTATNLSGPWQTEAVFTVSYTNPAGRKFFTPGWLSITNSVQ